MPVSPLPPPEPLPVEGISKAKANNGPSSFLDVAPALIFRHIQIGKYSPALSVPMFTVDGSEAETLFQTTDVGLVVVFAMVCAVPLSPAASFAHLVTESLNGLPLWSVSQKDNNFMSSV